MTSNRTAYRRACDQLVFRATQARSYLIPRLRFSTVAARPVLPGGAGAVTCRMR